MRPQYARIEEILRKLGQVCWAYTDQHHPIRLVDPDVEIECLADDGVDRCVCTDAEGKCGNRGRGYARTLRKHAQRIAEIPPQRFQPDKAPHLAASLLDQRGVAEPARVPAHFELKAQLVLEIAIEPPPGEELFN